MEYHFVRICNVFVRICNAFFVISVYLCRQKLIMHIMGIITLGLYPPLSSQRDYHQADI